MPHFSFQTALPFALVVVIPASLSYSWLTRLNSLAPEPYLDEVFHIPQAQAYCRHEWNVWDPKLTTPPGLYVLSLPVKWLYNSCSTYCLRSLNVVLLLLVGCASYAALNSQHVVGMPRDAIPCSVLWNHAHAALNITLFPCLFFFSGLYYTDVASTLHVLAFYITTMRASKTWYGKIFRVLLAVQALLMRQTNIFWVAIFPAGLALVGSVRATGTQIGQGRGRGTETWDEILKQSWTNSSLYDPAVYIAHVEDYILAALSLVLVSLRNLTRTVQAVLPHIATLASFGAFVFWNGGVVLGDKSNHVATIHLPQMLYVWPYMVFFSFPLMAPSAIMMAKSVLARLRGDAIQPPHARSILPRPRTLALFTFLAAVTIRFNTIVHPFTLADNRHYMFYVFRILLHDAWIKYGAAIVYVICAWLAISTLGIQSKLQKKHDGIQQNATLETQRSTSCKSSFVLVWLASITLSVVTAPLVEPRYFIIPWLMWRLHVPMHGQLESTTKTHAKSPGPNGRREAESWTDVIRGHDHRLWLETAWFLAVNYVTGYFFLNRGFSWPQEPGKVQRFMW